MPKISMLTADRLRELARTGAEVTLKRLRAEIIAIERAFPRAALASGPTCAPQNAQAGTNSHAHDVGVGAEGGLCAHETRKWPHPARLPRWRQAMSKSLQRSRVALVEAIRPPP